MSQEAPNGQPAICPMMSRPVWNSMLNESVFAAISCRKEACMAWHQSGELGTCALIPGVTVENAPLMVDEAEDRRDS